MAEIDSSKLWTALNALELHPKSVKLHILKERQLDAMCQYYPLKKNDIARFVFSGSTSEGTKDFNSDFDVMHLFQNFIVTDKRSGSTTYQQLPDGVMVSLLREDITPTGYAVLEILLGKSTVAKYKDLSLLSAKKCRQVFSHYSPYKSEVHGPSLRGPDVDPLDEVPCIKCPVWPQQAQEWVTRKRSFNWPSQKHIELAQQDGCLLVPTGVSDSPNEDNEWRFSFSVLERELIWSWNNTQLKCFVILKCINKQVISRFVPGMLCSYYLKNLMFWHIENTSAEIWTPERMGECIMELLNVLLNWIEKTHCPHYFIREVNLFRGKVCGKYKQTLVREIKEILSKGLMYCVKQCPQLREVYTQVPNYVVNMHECALSIIKEGCYYIRHLQGFAVRALSDPDLTITISKHQRCIKNYTHLWKDQSVRVRKLLKVIKSYVHTSLGSHLLSQALETDCPNTRDAVLSKALYHLECGENSNALEASLKLAMFYYMIGHYSVVLDIIFQAIDRLTQRYVQNESNPNRRGRTASADIHPTVEDHRNNASSPKAAIIANKKRSQDLELTLLSTSDKFYHGVFVKSPGIILTDPVSSMKYYVGQIFYQKLEMRNLPSPFTYDINCTNTNTHQTLLKFPVVMDEIFFYYFMQFMSFYQMNNQMEMQRTVTDFDRFITLKEREQQDRGIKVKFPYSNNLLVQCFMMAGDLPSAVKVIQRSHEIESNYRKNAALWMLAVYLYQQFQLMY